MLENFLANVLKNEFELTTDLGPDYMANFGPGWKFSPINRAETSARLLKQILLK